MRLLSPVLPDIPKRGYASDSADIQKNFADIPKNFADIQKK